jgi:hypothetical protein
MDWRAVRAERRAARALLRAERRMYFLGRQPAVAAHASSDPDMPPLLSAATLLLPCPPTSEGSLQLDSLAAALLDSELECALPAWEGRHAPPTSDPPTPRHSMVSVRSIFYTTSLPALLLLHPAMGCEDLCSLLDSMWQKVHPGEELYLSPFSGKVLSAQHAFSHGKGWGPVEPGTQQLWDKMGREEQMGHIVACIY